MVKIKTCFFKIFFYISMGLVFLFISNTFNLIYILKNIQNLPELPKPYEMMRFVIHSYGDNSITARFWFYDQQGNELSSLERTWSASHLQLTFEYLSYNNKSLVYPIAIQNIQVNRKRQSPGTDLRSFVQSPNYDFYQASTVETKQELKALARLETFILNKNSIYRIFSLFYHRLVETKVLSLENSVRGFVYSVYYEEGEFYIQ